MEGSKKWQINTKKVAKKWHFDSKKWQKSGLLPKQRFLSKKCLKLVFFAKIYENFDHFFEKLSNFCKNGKIFMIFYVNF